MINSSYDLHMVEVQLCNTCADYEVLCINQYFRLTVVVRVLGWTQVGELVKLGPSVRSGLLETCCPGSGDFPMLLDTALFFSGYACLQSFIWH